MRFLSVFWTGLTSVALERDLKLSADVVVCRF